jgi:outer membrane protein OmpA-like peptidoglycan-associated protein
MEHLDEAKLNSDLALKTSKNCGTKDQDNDAIPDVIDRCPLEPEDRDGDRDFDGCRDIAAYDDEDGDGIVNIDDDCVDDAEDFDNDRDHDGCPETNDDGDGDGFIDAIDKCRDQAEDLDGFMDDDGCPDPDNDQDGVPDIHDDCSLIPEDLDGWADDDGCPDPDNDEDGIPDIHDNCPNQPGGRLLRGCPSDDSDNDGIGDDNDRCPDALETVNGYLDGDGCPDEAPLRLRVTKTRIELNEHVQFEEGISKLAGVTFPLLDDIVRVLLDVPDMRLRIEGHTDSVGTDEDNMLLSQQRAAAVRVYMEAKGIADGRLSAAGFGETRPIDTNRTASGRETNRRIEFHITVTPTETAE